MGCKLWLTGKREQKHKRSSKKKEEDYLKSVKVSDSKVGTYLAEDLGSECEKANEIYLKTRIIQLKLIQYT